MDINRFYMPDAIYFVTCVNYRREPIFSKSSNVDIFMKTLVTVRDYYLYELQAYVIIPDHFHLLIKPIGCTISKLIQSLRRNFTVNFKNYHGINKSLTLAQHRFYDHVIRNDKDWSMHMDYIHYNPVKHGMASKPEDWPYSSYFDCVNEGFYEIGWGCNEIDHLKGMDME
jgi:putative transposase